MSGSNPLDQDGDRGAALRQLIAQGGQRPAPVDNPLQAYLMQHHGEHVAAGMVDPATGLPTKAGLAYLASHGGAGNTGNAPPGAPPGGWMTRLPSGEDGAGAMFHDGAGGGYAVGSFLPEGWPGGPLYFRQDGAPHYGTRPDGTRYSANPDGTPWTPG
jgi:hypothetical protein